MIVQGVAFAIVSVSRRHPCGNTSQFDFYPCSFCSRRFLSLRSHIKAVFGERSLISSGAAIAGANVSLRDEATKLVRNAVTTASGEYVFTAVEPATYTLSTASAFKQYEQTSLKIAAQEFKTIDLSLVLGANAEMVEVQRSEPLDR